MTGITSVSTTGATTCSYLISVVTGTAKYRFRGFPGLSRNRRTAGTMPTRAKSPPRNVPVACGTCCTRISRRWHRRRNRGDLARVVVPTAATPFYEYMVREGGHFRLSGGKRTFDDAPNYPLSEMGLKNVNRAILAFCRGLNALGGGDRDTPAGLRQSGEIDPLCGAFFEWNPSHVEHVLTYYGGGMGKFVKDVVHTVQSLVEPDAELNSYDLPIINRLYGTTRKENPANRYYTMKERMTNLAARYRRMGDGQKPQARRHGAIWSACGCSREYDRIVNRIRKVMAGTNPGSAEYEKLQQELDATMREYLQTDERYVTGN